MVVISFNNAWSIVARLNLSQPFAIFKAKSEIAFDQHVKLTINKLVRNLLL